MKPITSEELKNVLEKHEKWLKGEEDGERAVLDGASLNGASLRGASLDNAFLNGASLDDALLCDASLNGASLDGASLCWALLDGASLNGASLDNASLNGALLRGASLNGASLDGASLNGASLVGVKGMFVPQACPDSGSFIGWKKCRSDIIAKLFVPDDAKRSSAAGRKCRCSSATVLALENIDGTPANVDCAYSKRDSSFEYRAGEIVSVDNFDENRWNECAPGIHFFVTREEAVKY